MPDYADIKRGMTGRQLGAYLQSGRVRRNDLEMVIPPRTLARRLKDDKALPIDEADAVARLIRVRTQAEEAFDDPDLAELWLRSENPELMGERPIEMARTDVGARELETVLTRFEHGVFS